jgi:hypothetical protein
MRHFPAFNKSPPVIAGSLSGSQAEDKNGALKPSSEQVSFWNHVEAYFAG